MHSSTINGFGINAITINGCLFSVNSGFQPLSQLYLGCDRARGCRGELVSQQLQAQPLRFHIGWWPFHRRVVVRCLVVRCQVVRCSSKTRNNNYPETKRILEPPRSLFMSCLREHTTIFCVKPRESCTETAFVFESRQGS